MSATPKRKLCWNCDGSLSLAVDQCTYCGASLKEGAAPKKIKKLTVDRLAPPYAMLQDNKTGAAPQPPFDILGKGAQDPAVNAEETGTDEQVSVASEATTVFSSILFLLGGSVFFLFGLVLWLFSHNGVFTLNWNGDYWYVYLSGGLALLLMGWRAILNVHDPIPTDEHA